MGLWAEMCGMRGARREKAGGRREVLSFQPSVYYHHFTLPIPSLPVICMCVRVGHMYELMREKQQVPAESA